MASIRRVNTLTLDFGNVGRKPEYSRIHELIRTSLKFSNEEIVGIQVDSIKAKVYIKCSDRTVVQRAVQNHDGKIYYVDQNNQRYPIELYEEEPEIFMKLFDFPLEMSNEKIKSALMKFGSVKTIKNDRWKGEGFYQVENGVRTVVMNMTKPVPSYLRLDGYTSLVTYHGQIRTCMMCDQPGHERRECPKLMNRRLEQIRRPDAPKVTPHPTDNQTTIANQNIRKEVCVEELNIGANRDLVEDVVSENVGSKENEEIEEDQAGNKDIQEVLQKLVGAGKSIGLERDLVSLAKATGSGSKCLEVEHKKRLERKREKEVALLSDSSNEERPKIRKTVEVSGQEMEVDKELPDDSFDENEHVDTDQFDLPSLSPVSVHGESGTDME